MAASGARGLDLLDAGTIAIDRDHPQLAGVADEDLPLALATCSRFAPPATVVDQCRSALRLLTEVPR